VSTTIPSSSGGSHGITTGAIAGIAIGVAATVAVVAAVVFLLISRYIRRQQKERGDTPSDNFSKAELSSDPAPSAMELSAETEFRYELAAQVQPQELDSKDTMRDNVVYKK
jgi:hypothetical protein